jgi:hypothetical protein
MLVFAGFGILINFLIVLVFMALEVTKKRNNVIALNCVVNFIIFSFVETQSLEDFFIIQVAVVVLYMPLSVGFIALHYKK